MKKSRIFAGAALAAGIGLMVERGMHSSPTGEEKQPSVAKKLQKLEDIPQKKEPQVNEQFVDKKVGVRVEVEEDAGDTVLEEEKATKEETLNQIEQIIAKVFSSMPKLVEGKINASEAHPGGYYSIPSRENRHYQIKQITGLKSTEGGESEVSFRDVATVEVEDDGSVFIQTFGKIPDIHCDVSSLENILDELVKFKNLESGSIQEYSQRIAVEQLSLSLADMDELLRAKQYYAIKVEEEQALLTRNWDFVSFDRESVQRAMEENGNKLIEVQKRIIEMTQ